MSLKLICIERATWLSCDDALKKSLYSKIVILISMSKIMHRFGCVWSAVKEWMASRKLKSLGVPRLVGFGLHDRDSVKYRFMVMDRFGTDLQKLFEGNGKHFPTHTVFLLGLKLVLTRYIPRSFNPLDAGRRYTDFAQTSIRAGLRYTVRTASYQARRPTVYHRYGS